MSLGLGLSKISSVSLRRLIWPSPVITVSLVSSTMARLLIMPWFTSKAAAAHLNCTLRSPLNRNLITSPPSSPMNSSRMLLISPLPIKTATLPDAEPSISATELPRPFKSNCPLILPRLVLVFLTVGNSWLSCKARASRLVVKAAGVTLASIRIVPATDPPAIPNEIGSSCSTPALSLT